MPEELIEPFMSATSRPMHDTNRSFTVGAIGHRALEGSREAIWDQITLVLPQLRAEHPNEQMLLICSIAEGADRLLLSAAANFGIAYDCVLPCSPDCFRDDFRSQESRDEFDRLLAGARMVVQPDESIDKETGYLWTSNTVIDRADMLIAVWDGGPGHGPAGTAETVARALTRGIPVIWIPTHSPYIVRMLEPKG
jgi:hypothetical protein